MCTRIACVRVRKSKVAKSGTCFYSRSGTCFYSIVATLLCTFLVFLGGIPRCFLGEFAIICVQYRYVGFFGVSEDALIVCIPRFVFDGR